ncbi:hypothetical protein A2954_04315 [Candidatus Roizmanbacteria bacterium RIFCSPLOWO2_01_FULL_37_12]|uniref:Prolipoprotein diacylglyceryl transferase n=1 Tax=Candidatus Roizmanbacteria bacterium RIFCSPLOWO2_01_FULL_37_12 TaxID=1802056 RepID=A0A1F7IFS0_9BACT|nr:MAG: hypothetical protein A3D76_06225 [Candidatus Roizmanbacteria bacterium RIFCSPHIGHO2_02_FULL_37_9b]OGK42208.1 MAG: hypothetical protein A2954_04315 [Candidatus Roizmanbacteria bacterium RIFCSPLOWO2_01_FULL_37_12]
MLPVLLDFKFIKIYTFGIFLVLAFFWGSFLLWRIIRLTSQKEDLIFDGLFLSITGGLFVSRVVYVALNFEKFGFDILKFILINGYPGLSLYGALIGAFISLYVFFLLKKINFRDVADYFITPLFIALTFGKLGSFFSGSEIGSKTKFPIALKYFGYDGFRHLTPLYEAIFFCLGAYISYKLIFEVRRERFRKGFVFYFFCWYFALIYILFDKIKANPLYLIPFKSGQAGFSFNFILSGVILLIVSVYFLINFRSSLLAYGKIAYKKITKRFAGSFGDRSKKSAKTDRGIEKK